MCLRLLFCFTDLKEILFVTVTKSYFSFYISSRQFFYSIYLRYTGNVIFSRRVKEIIRHWCLKFWVMNNKAYPYIVLAIFILKFYDFLFVSDFPIWPEPLAWSSSTWTELISTHSHTTFATWLRTSEHCKLW